MRIKSFHALRPPVARAQQVAAPPYDVVDTEEARRIAADNPLCFLRIARSEIELPPETHPYDDAVYQRAADNLARFVQEKYLEPAAPALYVYRLEQGAHSQSGVVTVCHIDDYDQDVIKRHEKTRKPTEDDRTRHVDETNANTGPVFLTYRDQSDIDALVATVQTDAPLYDFVSVDGVRNIVWQVEDSEALVNAFAAVPVAYVADGHHRAASAARVARLRGDKNAKHTGREEYNWFLAVLFPGTQLRVLPYNRCVMDLNGLSPDAFMEQVRARFSVAPTTDPAPATPGAVHMFINGQWHALTWDHENTLDPVASLDVSVLQDRLLAPLLGIDDPRNNPRIEFVGGVRGTKTLEDRVTSGRSAVAFSMYPVTVEQLMAVADAGRIMPPKSTWFEPKLKSGLLVHPLSESNAN